MLKNKRLTLTLAFCLSCFMVISLCACTVNNPMDSTGSVEEESTTVVSESVVDEEETTESVKELVLDETITIDGTELKLKTPYKDFIKESGLELADGSLTLPAYTYYTQKYENPSVVEIITVNNSYDEYSLNDCIVLSSLLTVGENTTFTYGSITEQSTEEDIRAAFGEPTEYTKNNNYIKLIYRDANNSALDIIIMNGKISIFNLHFTDGLSNIYNSYSQFIEETPTEAAYYSSVADFFDRNPNEYDILQSAATEQNVQLSIEENNLVFNYTYNDDEFNNMSTDEAKELLAAYMEENQATILANIDTFAESTLSTLLTNSNIESYKIIWNYCYKEEVLHTIELEKVVPHPETEESVEEESVEDASVDESVNTEVTESVDSVEPVEETAPATEEAPAE